MCKALLLCLIFYCLKVFDLTGLVSLFFIIPILKSQRLQKKFAPPGKSTQREDITWGLSTLSVINHTQRKRYQTHVVDPPLPGINTQREDITRGLSTLFAVNHTQRKRYQTHVVDPILTPLPFWVFLWMGRGAPTFSYRKLRIV